LKKIAIIMFSIFLTVVYSSCGKCCFKNTISEKKTSSDLARFLTDGKYGFKDRKGNVVIRPVYLSAYEFTKEGIAAVVDKSGWHYINRWGKTIARPFIYDNGPDYFKEGLARIVSQKKIGFMDKWGRTVIKTRFQFAYPFREGRAVVGKDFRKVMMGSHELMKGGKWGFIDKKGKLVIAMIYGEARFFEGGKARVKINGKWITINLQGKKIQ